MCGSSWIHTQPLSLPSPRQRTGWPATWSPALAVSQTPELKSGSWTRQASFSMLLSGA